MSNKKFVFVLYIIQIYINYEIEKQKFIIYIYIYNIFII